MSLDGPSSPQIPATFRAERFIENDPIRLSLIKIGEYCRTPLYEPSLRAMCLSLSNVRTQLKADLKVSKKLSEAWQAATKIFKARSTFFQSKFHGPEEYCIALICFTLGEPFNIYQEFGKLSQDLVTNTFCYFPYKSLFYLLIQAETRLRFNDDPKEANLLKRIQAMRHPITITTDLDYSIEEAEEEESDNNVCLTSSPSTKWSLAESNHNPVARKIHSTSIMKEQELHNVYLGFAFPLSETAFKPRTLVAFTHIMSTTLDGMKLTKLLEERNKPVTLVEINQVGYSSRYIASLSVLPVEKEVVVWPWIKFYVEERQMVRPNVEKIVLKPTSRSFVRTAAEIESLHLSSFS